ncbi:Uncharacterised protein [Blautia obeum]|uniref:Uncharacterized protein n=1 Tax=Blautia obeum TaxID=40520 RepID=A0A174WIE2_9FIRM|nr:Uncharacterised protein [Blautia obeum]
MISLNSVRPFCWFHTYYLITTRFRINNAKISRVIILLSNRTLSALKCPVYKGFQKIFCHCATPFDTFFVNPFDALLSSQNRSQNRTATCTTHTPHPKMKISRLQNHLPELLFSLFFLLIFVLLSGTFATFFAIFLFLSKSLNRLFSRLSVYFKASYC